MVLCFCPLCMPFTQRPFQAAAVLFTRTLWCVVPCFDTVIPAMLIRNKFICKRVVLAIVYMTNAVLRYNRCFIILKSNETLYTTKQRAASFTILVKRRWCYEESTPNSNAQKAWTWLCDSGSPKPMSWWCPACLLANNPSITVLPSHWISGHFSVAFIVRLFVPVVKVHNLQLSKDLEKKKK